MVIRFVALMLLAAALPLVTASAATAKAAQTAQQQAQSVDPVIAALETYAAENGTYKVAGSGWYGRGVGWFDYSNGSSYPVSIADTLIDGGYLVADEDWLEPFQFMIRLCNDRAAVFSASTDPVEPAEAEKWEGCSPGPPISHPYYRVTKTVDEMQAGTPVGQQLPTPEWDGAGVEIVERVVTTRWLAATDPNVSDYEVRFAGRQRTFTKPASGTSKVVQFTSYTDGKQCVTVRAAAANGRLASEWTAPRCGAVGDVRVDVTVTEPVGDVGQTNWAVVLVDTTNTDVGAMQVGLSYDPAALQPVNCSITTCNAVEPGRMTVADFNLAGWGGDFQLAGVEFEVIGAGSTAVDVVIEAISDSQNWEPPHSPAAPVQPTTVPASFAPPDASTSTRGPAALDSPAGQRQFETLAYQQAGAAPTVATAATRLATQAVEVADPDALEATYLGDVNCDGQVIILDAYIVAQAAVDLRTGTPGCVSSSSPDYPDWQRSGFNEYAADPDLDGQVFIFTAADIAACSVGLVRPICIDAGDVGVSITPTSSTTATANLYFGTAEHQDWEVRVDGEQRFFADPGTEELFLFDPLVTPGGAHEVALAPIDQHGRQIGVSFDATVQMPISDIAPYQPFIQHSATETSIALEVVYPGDGLADDAEGVVYQVYVNGGLFEQDWPYRRLTLTGLTPGTNYDFEILAIDVDGYATSSGVVTVATVAPPDNTAPIWVKGAITATDLDQPQHVHLEWCCAQDRETKALEVFEYEILLKETSEPAAEYKRVTGIQAQVLVSGEIIYPRAEYTFTDLQEEVPYSVAIVAIDEAGNRSVALEKNNIVAGDGFANPVDTDRLVDDPLPGPGASGNPQQTDPPVQADGSRPFWVERQLDVEGTDASVDLVWTPAYDNVGVVSYRIYVDDQLVGSSPTSGVTLTGLVARAEYTLRIEAVDAAGLESVDGIRTSLIYNTATAPVIFGDPDDSRCFWVWCDKATEKLRSGPYDIPNADELITSRGYLNPDCIVEAIECRSNTSEKWFRPEYTAQAVILRWLVGAVPKVDGVYTPTELVQWETRVGGRADIVYRTNGVTEIYEVKNANDVEKAVPQLARYVTAAKDKLFQKARPGTSLSSLIIPYRADNDEWVVWVPLAGIILFSKIDDLEKHEAYQGREIKELVAGMELLDLNRGKLQAIKDNLSVFPLVEIFSKVPVVVAGPPA